MEAVQVEQKTKGFLRINSHDERIKQEEEELKALQEGDQGEPEDKEEPANAEEASFKKRYGDLRRHTQKKEKELTDKMKALEEQVKNAANMPSELPASEQDLEAWMAKYPQVSAIVQTVATKIAREENKNLNSRIEEIDARDQSTKEQRAEADLIKAHPDWADISADDAFYDWVDEQSKFIQDAMYDNNTDAKAAISVVTMYKAEKGIKAKKGRKSTGASAALDVTTRGSTASPDAAGDAVWRESDIEKMSAAEYAKHEDEIMTALREGKVVMDRSGAAR